MRLVMVAALLGAIVGLSGCGSKPTDPYSNMQMLTPAPAGASEQEQDPVLQAEKAHNAKFIKTKAKRTR